jgi:hypothetical protein
MISRPIQRGAKLTVLQVIASYQINGTPELDLIDESGTVYEGCSLLSLGGGRCDFITVPKKSQDVLVFLDPTGTPVVLGALADQTSFVDSAEISTAGEYSTSSIALNDTLLQAGESRVVVSDEANKVFINPGVRIQGEIEVSAGGEPIQSVAVAEPLLETLESYRITLETVRQAIIRLIPPAITIASAIPEPETVQVLTDALLQLAEPIPAPNDTIKSNLIKTEE